MTPRSYNFTSAETPEFSEALQEQIRSLLLVCFGKKLTPTEAISYIDDLEHGLSVHITTIRLWYRRFELGDFSLEDHPRTGAPPVFTDDELTELLHRKIKESPRTTLQTLTELGHCSLDRFLRDFAKKGRRRGANIQVGEKAEVLKLCLHHVHRGASEQLWSVLFDQFDEQARAISEVEAVRFQLLAVLQGIQVMSTILSKGASVGNYKPLFQHCHESFELAQALPLDTLGTA
ncbi:hypothetical protein IW146_001272 [Coemansia sp. RSA 922]|nr:hypothetical protein IW146_001272 [Coemansia sp. RSA 922]